MPAKYSMDSISPCCWFSAITVLTPKCVPGRPCAPPCIPTCPSAALPFFNISRTIYWSSLKFVPPPEEEPSTPPRPPWAIDVGRVLAAVLVPVLALTLLALVVLLLQHRRRNYLSLLTGRALPPRHGPDVTLVATDIQNSTLLCECNAGMLPSTGSLLCLCNRAVRLLMQPEQTVRYGTAVSLAIGT